VLRLTTNRLLQNPWAKPTLLAASLLPFAYLLWAAFAGALGANPAEALIRGTGDWTLRFLCLTLAVTPLRQLTGLNALLRFRRLLGLVTFFYALLHVLCYSGFDMAFDLGFILAGTAALLMMAPLAATSFNRAIRALGAARWQRLHRLVYAVALAGLLHFWWMRSGKNDFAEPAIYVAIVAALLLWRVGHRYASRPAAAARARDATARPGAGPSLQRRAILRKET
jgi:sulfoxide reductase heme-binding subunit YedZ